MADLNLPSLSGKIDPAVKTAFQKILEWSRSVQNGTGQGPATSTTTTITNAGGAGEPDLATPIAPTGLVVSGVFNSIVLAWDYPAWTSPVYAYTEIWRSSTDDLGTAVKVTNCPANVFADVPPDSEVAETYYYWIRHVSDQGVAGPYNATAGTPGTTANNPEYFLQLLTGKVTSTQLHTDLTSVIDDIPGIQQTVTSHSGDIDGLHDQYVLKVNQNGRVSGFGFASTTPIDGTPYSEFLILADTFAVIDPDDAAGTSAVLPFIVDNGIVYMNIAMIKDATINSAKIQSLGVDKLVVGAGGATIPIALIGDATITTAKIAETLQSANYSPGQYGWRITKAGTVEFNQGLFRGAAVFTSPSTGYANFSDKPTALSQISLTDAQALTDAGALASAANQAASNAQTAADTANTALANIASDNILSPGEKPAVVRDYSVIINEQAGIDTQATNYGVTTEKDAYDLAILVLTSYLGGLSGWNTIPGGDVAIVGSTFRSKFADVYAKKQTLLNKIAANAKALADAAQTTANTANGYTSNWVRPGQTTIDGNKIYTGDAYVDTLQIKGQAVTFPMQAGRYTAQGGSVWSGINTPLLLSSTATITMVTSGAPVILMFGAEFFLSVIYDDGGGGSYVKLELLRDSTVIHTTLLWSGGGGIENYSFEVQRSYMDTPTAASHIYSVRINALSTQDLTVYGEFRYCNIVAIEAKR